MSGSYFYNWLFGVEKFWELSRGVAPELEENSGD